MQTNYGFMDWLVGRRTTFKAEGLGKLGLLDSKLQALAIEADDMSVYLRRFHAEHEWAILEPEEARRLASNLIKAADAVDAAQNQRPE